MDRKNFFTGGWKEVVQDVLHTPVGKALDRQLEGLANLLAPQGLEEMLRMHEEAPRERNYYRPPGATEDEDAFDKACTRCGDCIKACPAGTLFTLDPESGPLLDPETVACRLCTDYPCIQACETGALSPLPKGVLPGFGHAKLREDICVNETRPDAPKPCDKCEQICLVPEAVSFDEWNLPVFAEHCTGCGLCVEACPTFPPAIQIEP